MPDQGDQKTSPDAPSGNNTGPSTSSLFCNPQEIVTIEAGNKIFKVYKALLARDSEHLRMELRRPSYPGPAERFLGDDISAADFGLYVNVLLCSYGSTDFKFCPEHADGPTHPFSLSCLRLWRISCALYNEKMRDVAEDAFTLHLAQTFSLAEWKKYYQHTLMSKDVAPSRIFGLDACFKLCAKHNLPFQGRVVEAASNMPARFFSEIEKQLSAGFRLAVMSKMKKRSIPQLMSTSKEDAKGSPSAKRQKKLGTSAPKRDKQDTGREDGTGEPRENIQKTARKGPSESPGVARK